MIVTRCARLDEMIVTRCARLVAFAGLLSFADGASAQTMEEAKTAYAEGRFLEAADIAEALATSDGYALAAKSLAIHGHYLATEEERQGFFERAMRLGEKAVQADSSNAEAYYQSAHALGRYSQTIGAITALRKGYGGKIRDLLEATLARDSLYAEAHLALGGWHADIVDRAGRLVARITYGAKRGDATTHFERAMELLPGSRLAMFEYALRLPALKGEEGEKRAMEMMLKAARIPLGDAYDKLIYERLVAELEALVEEDGG